MAFAIVDGHRALEIGTPGPMRQRLNQLILDGHKRATAGLLVEYVREDEELESEGELLSLVDDENRRVATVRVGTSRPFRSSKYRGPSPRPRPRATRRSRRGATVTSDSGPNTVSVVDDLTPIVLIRFEVIPTFRIPSWRS